MSDQLLSVAVVGHTNEGKTSLVRTLTRDVTFGEVSNVHGVTRHVEGATLMADGEPMLALYDTPGLEDPIGLIAILDAWKSKLAAAGESADGIDQVRAFLDSEMAVHTFAQEAKALRQLLDCDAALYVIDVRQEVLGKHRDELDILARCARPIVPLLNFVASDAARTSSWRDHLARVNMHAVAEFDTVVIDNDSERRLFEKMRTLLDQRADVFDHLIRSRTRQREALHRASAQVVADMLIDIAALRMIVDADDTAAATAAMDTLRDRVRDRETVCVQRLLDLHGFRDDDCDVLGLPLEGGQWGLDLFDPATLKTFGLRAGTMAATGAMIGLSVDLVTGGLSLGAATALGAAAGAIFEAARTHGRRLVDMARGKRELRVDDTTLRLLIERQRWLVAALMTRGHASMQRMTLGDEQTEDARTNAAVRNLPDILRIARAQPTWSALNDDIDSADLPAPRETEARNDLARWLLKQ